MRILTVEQEDKITRFMNYSRGSRSNAIAWLEECKWDIEHALNRYWREVILICDME